MAEIEETLDRFKYLVNRAAESSTGNILLSHADFDELEVLAEILGPELPDKVHGLVKAGYNESGNALANFGQRVQRGLELHQKYPIESSVLTEESELLPTFKLDKKDSERVLKLCRDMRKIILGSTIFDEPHKKRLLNRVAGIEKQVLSKKGLFDVVLGGVSDVGETLGKFGTDIKPLTDRMNEVMKITRSGSKEYDQIPAPDEIKQLPAPSDPENEQIAKEL